MKTKDITQDLSAALLRIDKRSLQFLKQILSPLELSALRHNYKPFNYKFEGRFIYISGSACKQLMEITKHQVSFFTNQIEKDKHSRKIPHKLREVFEHPGEILSLPAFVRNRLCDLECYSMLRVMILGRQYFLERKEFGPKSIQVIDGLFEKYGCGDLFK
jgi:hypothetical protein